MKNISTKENIVAIIVTYNPQLDILTQLCGLLQPQVENVVVIDNGSCSNVKAEISKFSDCYVIELKQNIGIASAQNKGIEWAKQHKAKYVILFDQDSLPNTDMVEKLLGAYTLMEQQGHQVAAVGPCYTDPNHINISPFISLKGLNFYRAPLNVTQSIIAVDFLISSGCLISTKSLNSIGLMKADLFIDYVDTEWCLRAKSSGYENFGVLNAHMQHSLGAGVIKIFGRNFAVHNPSRHYYMMRNAILLYQQNWIPLRWKIADGWRLIVKFILYGFVIKPRLINIRMMIYGLFHGFKRRSGKARFSFQ